MFNKSMSEVNSIKDIMNKRNKICKYIDKLEDPKLIKFATGLIVVGGVIFISASVINNISYTMRKINYITTQLSDIKCCRLH